ncbi:hypothetical protein ACNOYE_24885 [Nannocystaceae bacterium ST9]
MRFELIEDHFPVIFIALSGEMQPQQVLQLIRFVDRMRERAAAERVDLLTICDARGAARPGELVRDMLVDWLRHELFGTPSPLGSIIVCRDPLVRGVIASIKWATGHSHIQVVPTPDEALARGRERFAQLGLTLPASLEPDDND